MHYDVPEPLLPTDMFSPHKGAFDYSRSSGIYQKIGQYHNETPNDQVWAIKSSCAQERPPMSMGSLGLGFRLYFESEYFTSLSGRN